MTDAEALRTLLALYASLPDVLPWHVTALEPIRAILIVDARDEATAMILEATAGQFGSILAVESTSDTRSGQSIIGCLVRPPGDIDEAAGRLRASYFIASEPDASDDYTGPF